MPGRYFTVAEAEDLLPAIEPVLREAALLKTDFDEADRELRAVSERIQMLGGVEVDRKGLLLTVGRRDALATRLQQTIAAVQDHGCVVKDLNQGLVDFPTLLRGEEVYLCWKLGETGIGYWHGLDEGFRGRKPIDQDFLQNHSGEG